MLLDLLFGTYRQRVLAQLLLHPESSYHVRELARLTGTTPGTLHKELSRLAEVGLLLREKQGNQVRYQANRECPVFSELAGLFRKTSGIVGDGGSLYLSGLSEKGTLNAVWGRGNRQRCAVTYALNKQNYSARTGLYSQEVVCQ